MAFRSRRSLSQPRQQPRHDTIESGGQRLYVETHLTTPHSLALPPLQSSSSDSGHMIRGSQLIPEKEVVDRKPRTTTSLHHQPHQPSGGHFFITPRESSSVCSGSILTADSRNPPQDTRHHRSTGRGAPRSSSIFRNTADRRLSRDQPRSSSDSGSNSNHDEFSAKVRREMKRMQEQTDIVAVCAENTPTTHDHESRDVFQRHTTHDHESRDVFQRQTSSRSRATLHTPQEDPRAKQTERRQRQILERNEQLEKDLAEKRSKIVDMKRDSIFHEGQSAENKRREEQYRVLMEKNRQLEEELSNKNSEFCDKTSELAMKDCLIKDLKHKVKSAKEDLKDIQEEYKQALTEAVVENEMLEKTLSGADDEVHRLKDENRMLADELEGIKRACCVAEEDISRCNKELEKREGTMQELESAIQEMDIQIGDITKENVLLESKYDEAHRDMMRHQTVSADMKESYKQMLEDKVRNENFVEEMKIEVSESKVEMKQMAKEHESMMHRMELLDEVTEALEIAIEEKEDALGRYKEFEMELEDKKQALGMAFEKNNDLMSKCDELKREVTILQSSRETANHMTEMATKQRDSMNAMISRYQREVDRLKQANGDLLNQRDDLKEELICVLETASVYRD